MRAVAHGLVLGQATSAPVDGLALLHLNLVGAILSGGGVSGNFKLGLAGDETGLC